MKRVYVVIRDGERPVITEKPSRWTDRVVEEFPANDGGRAAAGRLLESLKEGAKA